jgi:TRAP-type uncharacterized transport system substrate-binding protein
MARRPARRPSLTSLPQALHLSSSLTALREFAITAAPFVLLALALLAVAYWVLDPSPPRHVVLATGPDHEAYAEFGQRYAKQLARHGIRVELRPTAGAAENLQLLREGKVDVAFVQGGAAAPASGEANADDSLRSLGSMFYEPVWLFYRADSAVRLLRPAAPPAPAPRARRSTAAPAAAASAPRLESLAQVAGWRVDIGAPGSGVPNLARQLLDANHVDPAQLTLVEQAQTPAVVDLLEGRLDAVMFASAPESLMVQMLLQTPGIRLFHFDEAEAYGRRFPFLTPVTLPRGVVDLAADKPSHDVQLIAPTATLVARADLHPALVQLFVEAAQQIHGGAGWFQRQGDFPNAHDNERPLHPEAERIYTHGEPLLQRYLPFWAANLIDRMWVVLISIVGLLIPLSRVVPPLVEFRIRSRVFRWYGQLRAIEAAEGHAPPEELRRRLDEIEAHTARIAVPLSYADQLYELRSHIQLVRRRLQAA